MSFNNVGPVVFTNFRPPNYEQIIKEFDSYKAEGQTYGSVSKKLDAAGPRNGYGPYTKVQKEIQGPQFIALMALTAAATFGTFAILFGVLNASVGGPPLRAITVLSGLFGTIALIAIVVAAAFGSVAYDRSNRPFTDTNLEALRKELLQKMDYGIKHRGMEAERAQEYMDKQRKDQKTIEGYRDMLSREIELQEVI